MVGQGAIDIIHDQDLLISEARLSLDVGITRYLGASLMVPVRIVRTSIRYLDRGGSEVQLVNANIHHRNETVTGIADPMLLGSTSRGVAGWRLTARMGLTLPLGRREENPFTLGDMGLSHQHIQLGTGTVNPVIAAETTRSWGNWRFGVFALSQQVVYENSKGYHAGDRYAAGVALRRRLGSRWSVRGSIDALGETAERWDGIKHTDDGNQGRFDLIFGAGASWAATSKLGIDVALKIPAVTHVVGGQLDMPAMIEVGASWSLGGATAEPPKDDQDGHEHGEHAHDEHAHGEHAHDEHAHGEHSRSVEHGDKHPDAAGVDVADLGKPGEAVELVPVTGKITIFDFWAEWCQPCKVLEPALIQIARAHPDIVAVRRIDVVDWDSSAVAKHLTPKSFNLPHLKVFNAAGRMVIERSSAVGSLEALIKDVRVLVAAEAMKRAPTTTTLATPPPDSAPVPVDTLPPSQPSPRKTQRPAPAPIYSIVVTAKGFEPGTVTVPAGKRVTLRFLRTVETTCATEVVMTVDGKKIVKDLPLNRSVDLKLTFAKPGKVTYACAMDMIRGSIVAH